MWNIHVHPVFVTKYRRGMFDDKMLTRCEQVMREVGEDFGAEPREFDGEPDRVHLLSCGGAPLEIVKEYIRGQKRPDQAGASSRP